MTSSPRPDREAETLAPRFGDLIENGWASEANPTRRGYFVRAFTRIGRLNPGLTWEITDGKGKFWEIQPGVIGERLAILSALSVQPGRESDEISLDLRPSQECLDEIQRMEEANAVAAHNARNVLVGSVPLPAGGGGGGSVALSPEGSAASRAGGAPGRKTAEGGE